MPLSLALLVSSRIFGCYAFLTLAPEGDWRWKILFLLWQLQPAQCLHIANLGIYRWIMSPGFAGLGQISWLESYLRFLQWVGEITIFQRKDKAKKVSQIIFSTSANA